MNSSGFDEFFHSSTGHEPYDYQPRLACGPRKEGESKAIWLGHGTDCQSKLINVPTGPGKTAAVSTTLLSEEEQALVAELVADGLSIQERFRPEPLYKLTGTGHYTANTIEEIQQARKPGSKGTE